MYKAIKVTEHEEIVLGIESEYEDALNMLPDEAESVDGFVADIDHFIIETIYGTEVIEARFFILKSDN